jgi:hypothetical protein
VLSENPSGVKPETSIETGSVRDWPSGYELWPYTFCERHLLLGHVFKLDRCVDLEDAVALVVGHCTDLAEGAGNPL